MNLGRVGLGTGTLASLGRAASLREVIALLDAMDSLAVRTIDTADSYGSGDCERLLGKALRGRREHYHLITKAGYRHGNLPGMFRHLNQFVKKALHKLGHRQNFDSAYLSHCLDESLMRLGVDHVDAFLLHDPPAGVVHSSGVADFLHKIKEQGKALQVGVSSGEAAVLEDALESGLCDLLECPANMKAAPALLPIWETSARKGIHIVANHVYAPDCLALPGMRHESLMRATSALLPSDATILCGTRNPTHLASSLRWAQSPMTREEADTLLLQLNFQQ